MSDDDMNRKKELYEWQELDFAKVSFNAVAPCPFRRSIIMVKIATIDVSHVDLLKMMEGGMNVLRVAPHKSSSEVPELIVKLDKAAKLLAAKYSKNAWSCATALELQSRNITTGLLQNVYQKLRNYENNFIDTNFYVNGDMVQEAEIIRDLAVQFDRKATFIPHMDIITTVKSILLKENTEVILSYDDSDFRKCNENRVFVNNPYLTADVTIGLEISIAEDSILLEVTEIHKKTVKCIVIKEGRLSNMDTVCLRGAKRCRPFITKEDLEYVKMALENQMDMIIINYVRHPTTIQKIKQYMGHQRKRPWIASGICTMEGLRNIDDIIKESDVIIFSREKLAYELEKKYFSRMVRIQKSVVGKCKKAGRPIYLCGQVFQSMLQTSVLAYRDITDVANAILDGVSGVSLKACDDTDHLKLVMQSVSDLCKQMELFTCNTKTFKESTEGMNVPMNAAISAAMCCVLLANKAQAHAIIIPTVSGRTIYYVNQHLPICPIIAVTTNISVFRSLDMYRGVAPILFEGPPQKTWKETVFKRLEYAVEYGLDKGWLNYGDDYVTLEKDFEESTFCDAVRICKVTLKKQTAILCPDPADPNV